MAILPTGTVTFLFTDVEGSTRLWEEHPAQMQAALARHDELLRSSIEGNDGYVFSTAGDAFAAAFERVGDALAAAVAAQAALGREPWPEGATVRVRMGLHTGEAHEREGDYFGPVLNRAARIMSAGNGGQVLVSETTAGLAGHDHLTELGEHRLKDLSAPERLYQVGGGAFPSLHSLDVVHHNLPVERTPLVGRDIEIEQIAALVSGHRLVTLLGIGGTGKTRLASAVAAELTDRFDAGVWFVDLVPASDADGVVAAILAATRLETSGSDLVGALADVLDQRNALFVLDNCEHITDDVADVVDVLLGQTTAPRFLTTSREPLQLVDERQVHVAPLDVSDDMASPAVELFASAAERVGSPVSPDDVATVARICNSLDGLPLSVELAAAQLRQLHVSELADRLDSRFELLSHRRRGRGRRQASLIGVLEDSWSMLDVHEQELLLQLAAFPTTFRLDDVEAIAIGRNIGVVGQKLGGLVDRSLVARSASGDHRLSETVKLFARKQWAHTADPDSYLAAHTSWMLDRVGTIPVEDRFTSFDLAPWINAHFADCRAVEDRLAGDGEPTDLARLVSSLAHFYWCSTGPRASAMIDRIDRYLVDLPLGDLDRGGLHLVATVSGIAARRPDSIAFHSAEAVRLLRDTDTAAEYAMALLTSSWMTVFTDREVAFELVDQAIVVAESGGASAIADVALAYRANHLALAGRTDEALATLDVLRGRLGDRPFDGGWFHYYLESISTNTTRSPSIAHDLAKAIAAEFPIAFGDQGHIWANLTTYATAAAAAGDVDETRQLYAKAQAAVEDTANDDGLPDLLLPIAALAWAQGDHDRTRRLLTAIRRSSTPTTNFMITIQYRQLRAEVGLSDDNPLDTASLTEIYEEAAAWLASLPAPSDE